MKLTKEQKEEAYEIVGRVREKLDFDNKKELRNYLVKYERIDDSEGAWKEFRDFKKLLRMLSAIPVKDKEKKIEGVARKFLSYDKKTEKYSLNIDSIANYLIQQYCFRNVKGSKKEILHIWNGKRFKPMGESFVKEECEELLKHFARKNPITEILEKIKRKTGMDKEEFENNDKNFINLNNGVWDIKRKKLSPHSPKYNFRYIIPINKRIKPLLVTSTYLKFLEEALYPEDLIVFQELLGFLLVREYWIKKGFIFVGETDGGKSVAIDSLIHFIGEKNKSGLSLQDISCGSSFAKNSLKDKHLNCYDDLSSSDIGDGGKLKVATGGGHITSEEKFGDTSEFKTFAKLVFATNKIPPVKDSDDLAYFGRWIILRFDNPPVKKDPFLRDKIFTKEEMSWALNWALEGLYRLLENGEFSYKKTPQEIKKIMEMSGDPLVQFGEACLEKKENGRISKEQMYELYSAWANSFNPAKPLLSKEQLGRRLNQKVTYLIPKKDKERFWANGIIKQEWLNKLPKPNDLDTLDTISTTLRGNNNTTNIKNDMDLKVSNPPKDNNQDTLGVISQNKKLIESTNEIHPELKKELERLQ